MVGTVAKMELLKALVAHQLVEDLPKYMRKAWRRFDSEGALHRVGLSRYRPGAAAGTGMSLFVLGCAIGGVAALLFAPKQGTQFRTDIKQKAIDYMGTRTMSGTQEQARA